MKAIILILIIMLVGCNDPDTPSAETIPVDDTPDIIEDADQGDEVADIVQEVVKPPQGEATEVIIYPLSDKYLNGLRDELGAPNILTKSKWEQLCIDQNPTNKEFAYPMASVTIIEKIGFIAKDDEHSTYIRDNWFYGVDMDNAQVLDQEGVLLSNDMNWLIVQDAPLLSDFFPADSALYLFTNKIISAGHHYREDGVTVGTLLWNVDTIQAMFNTDNTIEVHYFCMTF